MFTYVAVPALKGRPKFRRRYAAEARRALTKL